MEITEAKSLGAKRAFSKDDFTIPTNDSFTRKSNIEQWVPKNSKNLFNNTELITHVKKLVNPNYTDGPLSLIIRGPIGSGKFELLRTCLKESDCNISVYDQEFSSEEFDDLKKSIVCSGIEVLMGISNSRVIIIKDYDNNLKHIQQQDIFKYIISEKTVPVFFTTHNLNVSASRSVPKSISEYRFEISKNSYLVELASKILSKTQLTSISTNKLNTLAKSCNGDIRYFIKTLQSLNTSNVSTKDINYDIGERMQVLSDTSLSLDTKVSLATIHTNFVVQQNYVNFYIKKTSKSRSSPSKKIKEISKISDWILDGNVVLNYVSKNLNWDDVSLCDQFIIMGTAIPLNIIEESEKNHKYQADIFKTISYPPNYKMTTDMSLSILEQISFIMSKLVKTESKKDVEPFIDFVYKKYNVTDSNLRVICKLANMDHTCKAKFTQIRTILKNVIKR